MAIAALVITLLAPITSSIVLAAGDYYAVYRVEWRSSSGEYIIGEVNVSISVYDEGHIYVDSPEIVRIIDYSLSDTTFSPEDNLDTVISASLYYLDFYAGIDEIGPDGSYHREVQTPDNSSTIVIDAVYDTSMFLLQHGVVKVVDSGTGEVTSYIKYDIEESTVPPLTAGQGGGEGGQETTNTYYPETDSVSGGVKEGDWAKYRVTIDLRDNQGNYLKASATVDVVFHSEGGAIYAEVRDVRVDSYDTNLNNMTQTYLEQAIESMFSYGGYVVAYVDPNELPSDGVITHAYEGTEYRAEYDTGTGVLKASTITVSGQGSGIMKFELADTSIAGLKPVAGGLALAGLPGGVTTIVVIVVIAVIAAVIGVVVAKRKRKPAQPSYGAYPPQPPTPPPPPPGQ